MKLRLIRQPNTITVTIADNEPFNLAQYGGVDVGAANGIYVRPGTGATFPVSGTVAVTGTFWQTTQPVSVASLPLPTGAATSALQLPDGHNVTVDNAAGAGVYVQPGTSTLWDISDRANRLVGVVYGSQGAQLQQKVTSNDLIVTLDGESVAVTGTFWQTTQPVSIASMPSTPVTGTFWQTTQPVSLASVPSHAVTNAGTFAVQVDGAALTALQLIDNFISGSRGLVTEDNSGSIKTAVEALDNAVDGNYLNVNLNIAGTDVAAGAGAVNAQTQRVTHASDDPVTTSVQLIDDAIISDDSGFTPASTKVMMVGFEADETSTDSVNEGDAGAGRMTLDRKQIVTPQPHTQGGLLVGNFTSGDGHTALTNSAQAIKASAGQVYGWYIMNPNGVTIYVHIYNVAAASVTVGTTTALMNLAIPAGSAANILGTQGISFDTAMSCAATTTGGGNTAPTTALEAMIFYY
jgi:hypothetical protein